MPAEPVLVFDEREVVLELEAGAFGERCAGISSSARCLPLRRLNGWKA